MRSEEEKKASHGKRERKQKYKDPEARRSLECLKNKRPCDGFPVSELERGTGALIWQGKEFAFYSRYSNERFLSKVI